MHWPIFRTRLEIQLAVRCPQAVRVFLRLEQQMTVFEGEGHLATTAIDDPLENIMNDVRSAL